MDKPIKFILPKYIDSIVKVYLYDSRLNFTNFCRVLIAKTIFNEELFNEWQKGNSIKLETPSKVYEEIEGEYINRLTGNALNIEKIMMRGVTVKKNIRLSNELQKPLEKWRVCRGYKRSEALRLIIMECVLPEEVFKTFMNLRKEKIDETEDDV